MLWRGDFLLSVRAVELKKQKTRPADESNKI